jgi:hypothetical protein
VIAMRRGGWILVAALAACACASRDRAPYRRHADVLVLFHRDSAGRVTGLTAATQRVQNLRFTKRGS